MFKAGWLSGVVLLLAADSQGEEPAAPAPLIFEKRGVYYFESAIPCPLAGVGTRAPNACNRVALDDDHTRVTVDQRAHRIVITNTHTYKEDSIIADVQLLGKGSTVDGVASPVAVHLKIQKERDASKAQVHSHSTTREDIATAEFDPFEVAVSNGKLESVVMTPENGLKAIREPTLMSRLASMAVEVRDNLADGKGKPPKTGLVLSDISIGLGGSAAAKLVLQARLSSLTADAPRFTAAQMLKRGDWELRLTALSSLLPKSVVQREMVLAGLQDLPSLQGVRENGLKKGESLVFVMKDGKGMVGVNQATTEVPGALDMARSFMEFSFIGSILAHQADVPRPAVK